ncbi:hypothetical protein C8J56DRAFT_927286, partial [Mycena floridula]
MATRCDLRSLNCHRQSALPLMDYLRTLGSAAVSTLVNKSGLNLPFSLGAKVISFDACNLYDGTKRDDGSKVSVFEYDFSQKQTFAPLAKNALRKLRTIRHPDVLKFMDAVESDNMIYIMTERVRPLRPDLQARQTKGSQEKEDWLLWGLHRISVALAFINDSCASSHGNVRIDSIFISPSGEWRLGGFELLSNPKDDAAVLYTYGHLLGSSGLPPEIQKDGFSALKQIDPATIDAYELGILLNETFNPTHHPPPSASSPYPPPTAASRFDIPTSVFPLFKKLLFPHAKGRLTTKGFLEAGMAGTGFFASNRLVKVCVGLDGFAVASEGDKGSLLRTLNDSVSSFPTEFATDRVLPSLVSALEFGGASAATILPIVLQIGKNVPSDDYSTIIVTPLVKLYASPDRGTRMALLDHLPEYVEKLDKKTVDKIFPHLQTGFSDTVAVIREATVKAIISIAPKVSDRILNNDLLRHLARMQSDPEASIRTNTCILIGRLGPTLGYHTKRKVLVPAFTKALKDVFVHARVAGLMSFMATIECFDPEDIATKVIPNISSALVDKEKLVRDQAFKAVDLFVKKLEAHVATMPETAGPEATDPLAGFTGASAGAPGTLVNSAAGAAGALAGWAISSLGKRLAATDMQSTMASAPGAPIGRPTSVPPPIESHIGNLKATTFTPAATSVVSSPTFQNGSMSKSKAMQLGSNRVPAAALADQWIEDEADNADDNPWGNEDLIGGQAKKSAPVVVKDPWSTNDNPWGTEDLIDVNADDDDWNAFETAPTPIAQPKPVSATKPAFAGLSMGSLRPPQAEQPARLKTTPSPQPVDDWGSAGEWDNPGPAKKSAPAVTTSPLSKEEKAAEMARRKEERKQRIAMLKEQKKAAQS